MRLSKILKVRDYHANILWRQFSQNKEVHFLDMTTLFQCAILHPQLTLSATFHRSHILTVFNSTSKSYYDWKILQSIESYLKILPDLMSALKVSKKDLDSHESTAWIWRGSLIMPYLNRRMGKFVSRLQCI